MLVLTQVSSRKTRRWGSIGNRHSSNCRRFSTTSGRFCSAASRVFFEGNLAGLEGGPDRGNGFGQTELVLERFERVTGIVGNGLADLVAMTLVERLSFVA